ncbi:MAG TPA: hypothetical protein VL049_20680, partial [Candidatus Dormibacteraeota bacterium]|nr:hypothetical protein [Candidatus Dormibacteraeota bacterium]
MAVTANEAAPAAAVGGAGPDAVVEPIGSTAPYPGLRPFAREESDIFFGREELVDELLRRLARARFLAIVGVSGCGKSSLLRAGLIPALETGFLSAAGVRWQIAEMRPGNRPMRRLAEALQAIVPAPEGAEVVDGAAFIEDTLRRGPGGVFDVLTEHEFPADVNLLLVVDQFEEIFRYRCEGDANEADAFVSLLLESAGRGAQRIFVVLGMRSDFLGECAVFNGLPETLNESQFLVPRLSREQRRAAIVGPAGVFDSVIAPALVTRLLNEMGSDPDQLPLMQHLLMRMWERARSRGGERVEMTVEDYEAVGGLDGALSQHADEAFDSLGAEQRRLAETLFRCATEHLTNKQDSRRPIRLGSVAAVARVPWRRLVPVVDAFRQPPHTFLMPPPPAPLADDTIIDITHESLIRAWGRLRGWVFDEGLRTDRYRKLAEAARAWRGHRRARSWLLSGAELDEALLWRERTRPTPAWAALRGPDFELAMQFLERSARRRRLQRLAAAGVAALIVGLGGLVAYRERARVLDDLERQRTERARQDNVRLSYDLANRAIQTRQASGASIETSALLAVEAVSRFASARSWQALTDSLGLLPLRERSQSFPDVRALAFDGEQLVAVEGNGDTERVGGDGVVAHSHSSCATCESLGTSANGRFVALGDARTIVVEDRREGRVVGTVARDAGVTLVAVSADGTAVATASPDVVRRLALDRRRSTAVRLHGAQAFLSPDTRLVAMWDDARRVIEVRTLDAGRGVFRFNLSPLGVTDVAFSPDGGTVAAAIDDGSVRVWSLLHGFETSRANLGTAMRGRVRLTLAPDGSALAALASDGVRVFDLHTRAARELFRVESPGRRTAAFSPDGRHLAMAGTGGVSTWDLTTGGEIARFVADAPISALAVSPNGQWVATASPDNDGNSTITFWSLPGVARLPIDPVRIQGGVRTLVFAPDSASLLAGRASGGLCRMPVAGLGGAAAPPAVVCGEGPGYLGALSADAARIAVGSTERTITVAAVGDGRVLAQRTARPSLVALSRDGRHAASVGLDQQIAVWDVEPEDRAGGAAATAPIDAGGPVLSLAISPGGEFLAWSTWSGSSWLKRVAGDGDGQEARAISLDVPVRDFDFSASGRYLLSGDQNGAVRVWDVVEQRAVAELPGEQAVADVAFSADERYLVTASGPVARVLMWRPEDLVQEACSRLSRPFSEEDWTQYVGHVPYTARCPQLTARQSAGDLEEARRLLSLGRVESAVALYNQAAGGGAVIPAEDWYRVCREGTTWGHPQAVLAACDQAVTGSSEPRRWRYLAWRGAARALVGRRDEGIDDLQGAVT